MMVRRCVPGRDSQRLQQSPNASCKGRAWCVREEVRHEGRVAWSLPSGAEDDGKAPEDVEDYGHLQPTTSIPSASSSRDSSCRFRVTRASGEAFEVRSAPLRPSPR
jgi:hypothetical protein